MTFSPRFAIVTGSSSGIGHATAVALAESGMDVGVTWNNNQDGAQQTAAEIRALGRRAVIAHLDTANLATCGDAVDALCEELGGVDVFVNNAGLGDHVPFLELTLDEWRHTVSVDLDGAFVCIQRAARRMVAAGTGGRIIATTSVHEHQPRYGSSAYVAAKHGLGGLIKTLALELSEHGITANAIAPGDISLGMTHDSADDLHVPARPGVPLGRSGDARDVAAVIAFLASPASAYVTGASWVVDGGMLQMGPQAGSHLSSNDWRSRQE